jgi:hypothetical protein
LDIRTGEGDCAVPQNSIRKEHSPCSPASTVYGKKYIEFRKAKYRQINMGSYSFNCHKR